MRELNKKHKGTVINETIKNFRIVGILTERKAIFIPNNTVW